MVELRRFELLTFSMPWKRATNCAKAPCSEVLNLGTGTSLHSLGVRLQSGAGDPGHVVLLGFRRSAASRGTRAGRGPLCPIGRLRFLGRFASHTIRSCGRWPKTVRSGPVVGSLKCRSGPEEVVA